MNFNLETKHLKESLATQHEHQTNAYAALVNYLYLQYLQNLQSENISVYVIRSSKKYNNSYSPNLF